MSRRRLETTRAAVSRNFQVGVGETRLSGTVVVGLFENGQPGELFIHLDKPDSLSGFLDGVALLASMALQHGVPLSTMCDKLMYTQFEPSGWTGDPKHPFAKSLLDYIFGWLHRRFVQPDGASEPEEGE